MGINVNIYTKHEKEELEKFLDYIKKNNSKNIAILIRHSIRYPAVNCDATKSHLTPEGKKLAFWYGTKLPKDRKIKIFHSPVKRCKQTAKYIKDGFESLGKNIESFEEKQFLDIAVINLDKFHEITRKLGPEKSIRKWLNKKIDMEILNDSKKVLKETLDGILNCIKKNAEEKYLYIYVDHDGQIFPIKEFILNLKHEETGWPDCLDGIIIIPQENNKLKIKWRKFEKIIDWKF